MIKPETTRLMPAILNRTLFAEPLMPFKVPRTRSRFLLAATLLIVLANLRAPIQQSKTQQPNVQPTAATQAGVLLGYAFPSAHNKVEYQTNWTVLSPTEAHVAATAPDIIVPRSTGFWRR
jgi:hypothetical protein